MSAELNSQDKVEILVRLLTPEQKEKYDYEVAKEEYAIDNYMTPEKYCVECERWFEEKEIKDGKCPNCGNEHIIKA